MSPGCCTWKVGSALLALSNGLLGFYAHGQGELLKGTCRKHPSIYEWKEYIYIYMYVKMIHVYTYIIYNVQYIYIIFFCNISYVKFYIFFIQYIIYHI